MLNLPNYVPYFSETGSHRSKKLPDILLPHEMSGDKMYMCVSSSNPYENNFCLPKAKCHAKSHLFNFADKSN